MDRTHLRDGDLEIGKQFEQESLERFVSAVDFVNFFNPRLRTPEAIADGAAEGYPWVGKSIEHQFAKFAYPAPRTFKYSEIVTPDSGYVLGVDSNGRNAQSQQMNPPAHAMSSLRLAATQREQRRGMVGPLISAMRANPARVPTGQTRWRIELNSCALTGRANATKRHDTSAAGA